MKQTKIESIIERTCDIITGMFFALVVWEIFISPNVDKLSGIQVVSIFTVISFIRGYFWRRFFNAELHKVVHQFLINFISWLLMMKFGFWNLMVGNTARPTIAAKKAWDKYRR